MGRARDIQRLVGRSDSGPGVSVSGAWGEVLQVFGDAAVYRLLCC